MRIISGISGIFSIVVISINIHAGEAKTKKVEFSGEAKNPKGEIVYTEKHKAVYENGEIGKERVLKSETFYYSPDGKLIAELKSDYHKSVFLPDYTFEDFRSGIKHIVVKNENKLEVQARESSEKQFEKKSIEITENTISGQGFNYFIRDHLDMFVQNENKDVRFVMPGLLDYFTFNIWPAREPAKDSNIVHIKMTVNSWVLKLFVNSIKMQYDKVKKVLLSYEGVSNLVTPAGKTQEVLITYKH